MAQQRAQQGRSPQGGQRVVKFDSLPETSMILEDRFVFQDESAARAGFAELQANSPSFQVIMGELQSRGFASASFQDMEVGGWTQATKDLASNQMSSVTLAASLGPDADGVEQGLLAVVARGVNEKGLPVQAEQIEIVTVPAGGDPGKAKVTYAVRDGQVVADLAAANIFQRLIACVRNSCASVCLGSLTACAGVFPVYLKCVAVACGGCALKCGACATCNCGFWCKWAVGCCD